MHRPAPEGRWTSDGVDRPALPTRKDGLSGVCAAALRDKVPGGGRGRPPEGRRVRADVQRRGLDAETARGLSLCRSSGLSSGKPRGAGPDPAAAHRSGVRDRGLFRSSRLWSGVSGAARPGGCGGEKVDLKDTTVDAGCALSHDADPGAPPVDAERWLIVRPGPADADADHSRLPDGAGARAGPSPPPPTTHHDSDAGAQAGALVVSAHQFTSRLG